MMSEQVISLPMHSELDNDQIKFSLIFSTDVSALAFTF